MVQKMLRVNVAISNISAERFLDFRKPFPPVNINTNLSLTGMERRQDDSLDVTFVLTVIYNPSVAQISLKGTAYVVGEEGETERVYKEHEEKKPPPQVIVQSVSNVAFIESILISRTLNVPPPVPLPQVSEVKLGEKKLTDRDYSA
jgi:hypothetical protein